MKDQTKERMRRIRRIKWAQALECLGRLYCKAQRGCSCELSSLCYQVLRLIEKDIKKI